MHTHTVHTHTHTPPPPHHPHTHTHSIVCDCVDICICHSECHVHKRSTGRPHICFVNNSLTKTRHLAILLSEPAGKRVEEEVITDNIIIVQTWFLRRRKLVQAIQDADGRREDLQSATSYSYLIHQLEALLGKYVCHSNHTCDRFDTINSFMVHVIAAMAPTLLIIKFLIEGLVL